ncbi:MAG: FmdB family zinc ribbon protein [Phycisphaerae bacterium]
MPTYDYECQACSHKFESFQSIKAAPIKICPVCGKSKVRRLIGSGGGLIFKGSGFYCTDYRDSGYKTSCDKEKSSSTTETKSTETKSTETKSTTTESKTETKSSEAKKD